MNDSSRLKLAQPIGLFSLTAIAINGIIGAGIFVLPAMAANILGPASPSAYVVAWLAALLIGLCFAELGSRFESSGGPYLYAREAFGNAIGFEVGWMFFLARLTAVAAMSAAFASFLGYFWPAVSQGSWRLIAITILLLLLTAANLLGVRNGIYVLNFLTLGKLLPLVMFICIGLFFVEDPKRYLLAVPHADSLQKASLLLIFAFTGFEYGSVPSEEVVNSKRNTPIALVTAISLTAVMYILIQVVSLGTLPGLSADTTPLASAELRFLRPAGGTTLMLGAFLSTKGTISAAILVGSRTLYALAKGGQLPDALGRIRPRYLTPYISVALFGLFAWAVASYSEFAQLAALSAIARVIYYVPTCLAVPVLRRRMPPSLAQAGFTIPGRSTVPALAILICIWLLMGTSRSQLTVGVTALLVGAVVYWAYRELNAAALRR